MSEYEEQKYRKLVMDTLVLEIYTFGFGSIGEAILILIKRDDAVTTSVLIDSYYSKRSENYIQKVLEDNSVQFLSMICWTHPHSDHSKGLLRIIQNYSNKDTLFVYPSYLVTLNWKSRDKDSDELIEFIRKCHLEEIKYIGSLTPVSGGQYIYVEEYSYLTHKYPLVITILTPHNARTEKKSITEDEDEVNDFSLAINLKFNNMDFLFAGDIHDASIFNITHFMKPENLKYLKIPHHGSIKSLGIIKLANNKKIQTAVVTGFAPQSLPTLEALHNYLSISTELYSISKTTNSQGNPGYVISTYDLINNYIENNLIGSAIKYSIASMEKICL